MKSMCSGIAGTLGIVGLIATAAFVGVARADVTAASKAPGELQIIDTGAVLGNDNDAFRGRVIAFVRKAAEGKAPLRCEGELAVKASWQVEVKAYRAGDVVAKGEAGGEVLCAALKGATEAALANSKGRLSSGSGSGSGSLSDVRFRVDIPAHRYSMIEYRGAAKELTHGLVPVRSLTKAELRQKIAQGKEYLLSVIDPALHGAHKYYYAGDDKYEDRIHTIYTSSLIFTLLRLQAIDKDARIPAAMERATGFILSMQERDPTEKGYGGFYYSYFPKKKEREPRIVVGTTSKTIFSLIDLYKRKPEAKLLEAARLGADFLISMQNPDGGVRPHLTKKGKQWIYGQKASMLYTGQTLSALSRMYALTKDERYRDGAKRTAKYMMGQVSRQGCYLGDDYRQPNPVSTSWMILSLFDFFLATDDAGAKGTVFRCAEELLDRQIDVKEDIYRYGRWRQSLSSSGNGWLNEVFSELYLYCKKTNISRCDKYKDAIVKVTRLLMQYTYTPENAFVVKHPEKAIGGVFWNVEERYVRTDAVCHAMNAYINMIGEFGEGKIIEVPEPPLKERLGFGKKPAAEEAPELDEESASSSEDAGE